MNFGKNTLALWFVAAAALTAPSVARSAQTTPAPQAASCCAAPTTRTATAAVRGSQGRFMTRGKATVWVQAPASDKVSKAATTGTCCAAGATCCIPGAACCGQTATATAACCAK